ncbi:MAG: hydrogen peroxide-inducible genes activator [Candidatus Eremiobacteraeota bacterium]|nr:hydrogen peroxide-inducible genes activator [Candidatus Eremiobacteraeota bacterium]MCW5869622.1 hydrogen peroxide-inducible genes activator [Candidatus Eremiobacteraeota bacterium]
MNRVSLKHLRYFQALAQERHFGRAAELCSVSQPALSVKVKEFEQIVGVQLVERDTRRVHLTRSGIDMAARIGQILQAVAELQSYAQSTHGLHGILRIGAVPTIAPYLLATTIRNLTRYYPGLQLQPKEAVTQKLVTDLLEARLDVALLALPVSEPALTEVPLTKEEFVLVRPFEDAEKPVPDAKALREMQLLLLEEGHCFRDQALSFCADGSQRPRHLMEGSSLSTLVQMVGVGMGVTLIPKMAVALETRSVNVSVARLSPPRPTRTIGLVWRKTHPLAGKFEELARVCL